MYIYAETAFHHEGDKNYLLKLVDEAKKAGVDGVKFQVLIDLDDFMSTRHSSYSDAKGWVLSMEDWREVFLYTRKLGLDIILMPLDLEAFTLLSEFDVKYMEIHSVSFKDTDLLVETEKYRIPLILGVGGRTREEVEHLIMRFSNRDIILMVGFQAFPSKVDDVNIGKIRQLKKMYKGCVIGYADHSAFDDPMAISSNEYAYILGARVFEKHISVNEGEERIDFQSAVSAATITKIRNNLLYIEGLELERSEDIFSMNDKEVAYRSRQKTPVAIKDLAEGVSVDEKDFCLKMIDSDQKIEDLGPILGKRLKIKILADSSVPKGSLE